MTKHATLEAFAADTRGFEPLQIRPCATPAQYDRLYFALRHAWNATRVEKDGEIYYALRRDDERALITQKGSVITY